MTVSVRVDGPDGRRGVVLSYRKPGAADSRRRPMTKAGGPKPGRRRSPPTRTASPAPGSLRFFVTRDRRGPEPHTCRLPSDTARSIAVVDCANAGPDLASLKAVQGPCSPTRRACDTRPKTTTVSLTAKDVDGVDAVTLHYRLPGDSAFRDKPMAKNGSSWRATVTPVDQRPNADGKVTYYVTGKDALGESTRSGNQSFIANRCNFPADFGTVNFDVAQGCASAATGFANINRATDRDGLTASSAKVVYSVHAEGQVADGPARSRSPRPRSSGTNTTYSGQVAFTNLEPNSIVTMSVTLTDKYGVTNKDLQHTFKFQASASC